MLTGPHAQLHLRGTLRSFVIMFQSTGLRDLFAVPLKEVTNAAHDARLVLGKNISELQERLEACRSFEACIRTADAFLSRLMAQNLRVDRAAVSSRIINASRGCVRIPAVAGRLGVSQRQLERDFAASFGMSPKLYARIVRFQAAIDCKARSSTKSWTEIAHEFGYYDQMHLIHDFEDFSLETPTENLRLLEAYFRQQIDLIQQGMGVHDARLVPRFVI